MGEITKSSYSLGLPNLQVGEVIGGGGFAKVYRGYDSLLKRELAIKILRPVAGIEAREAFENEAGIHGPLSRHPNIVTIHHAGFTDHAARPYLVMDLVEGGSLGEYLRASGTVAWQHAASWMIPVCGAVQHAHDNGVLHRDIKPDNILLDPPSTPLLSDLGIACLQDDTSPIEAMSFSHVAPEALRGARRESPSDVFSLATTLYELIAGHPPFGCGLHDRLGRLNDPPPALPADSLAPPWLDATLRRAMVAEPAGRTPTAEQLERELTNGLNGRSVRTPTVLRTAPARELVDSRPTHPSAVPGEGAGLDRAVGLGFVPAERTASPPEPFGKARSIFVPAAVALLAVAIAALAWRLGGNRLIGEARTDVSISTTTEQTSSTLDATTAPQQSTTSAAGPSSSVTSTTLADPAVGSRVVSTTTTRASTTRAPTTRPPTTAAVSTAPVTTAPVTTAPQTTPSTLSTSTPT
ncbi:MAG: serine/threonine protein kinase, partial [Acidimicrobiia bacterium]|nr:serine/threonine protein kinase [Acidimicrobiia bacterium]